MKIAVLGTKGMLAHVMIDVLSETHDVTGISLRDKLFSELKLDGYDVVINCVGVLVEESEAEKDFAVLYNSYLPHLLEKYFADKPTKLIHISTDCINDDTFYGRSKALGEIDNDKDLTIRTSIIGPTIKNNGNGLFNWFMNQKDEVQGYTEAYWGGVTTLQLAKIVNQILDKEMYGIAVVATEEPTSKYDLLRMINVVFGKKIKINPVADGVTKVLVPNITVDLPHLEQLAEMKDYIDARPKKYSHYLR